MSTVIKVENISKQYRLGLVGTQTMRDDLIRFWATVRGKEDPFQKIGEANDRSQKADSDYVWSLKNIDFEVKQGDVLGIIGKNGAGKSTLLKILSKITAPTEGTVKIKGRIASLLEVGTGFHPELTGKENVYLNGAILGMRKTEIKRKFDEIVDFSGVESYIDTPVKRYSSGMYVRLAFAVAAHLEPEILIVDEVLAVGDLEFQKKAIGKMKDVSNNQGRTVIFVSHNMTAIRSLCNKGILLSSGLLRYQGNVEGCVQQYISNFRSTVNHRIWKNDEVNLVEVVLKEAYVKGKNKSINDNVDTSDALEFLIKLENKTDDRIDTTLHLKDGTGEKLFSFSSSTSNSDNSSSDLIYKCVIPSNFFNSGRFSLDLYIVKNRKFPIYIEHDFLEFTMNNRPVELGQYMGDEPGALHPFFEWEINKIK
jgi:lipopolysaccharide transport system ATP-binding protein